MTYRVTYRDDSWVRAANGAPEWRQVVGADIGGGATLVVVIVRSAIGGAPQVAEARIEQPYITRTAEWKRRTVKRLRPQVVALVGDVGT